MTDSYARYVRYSSRRRKTWNLVSDSTSNDVISWNEHGRTFTVWKPDVLETEYLPKTFKHSNFASFVRQLNNYGFRKCHSDRYEFGVEGFEKGKPELLTTLKRHDAPRSSKAKAAGGAKKGGAGTSKAGAAGGGAAGSLALKHHQDSIELGAYGGLVSEVEQLKRDRLLLLKEVMRLREAQHTQREEVSRMNMRLKETENFQTQMRHFVQAVHDGENINAALRESGLAGLDANAALSSRKRRTAPRFLPTLEGPAGSINDNAAPDSPMIPPSPLSLEEIDDEHWDDATMGVTTPVMNAAATLPWHEFLKSPTNEGLRHLVEDMSYEGELDAARLDERDDAFVNSLFESSIKGGGDDVDGGDLLNRQLSLSFLDSDEMADMVKEMAIGPSGEEEIMGKPAVAKAAAATKRSPTKKK